tara:strand:- start:29095 stop:29436 length:342 start_codon:yes stop_codon:yes gene_type:complete
MSSANTAERNARANDFAADYATASLKILDGATVLADYTLAGFAAASAGSVTANAVASVTNDNTGTADGATLTAGTQVYTLTVGTSGADVTINDLDFIAGVTSNFNSLVVTVPA